MRREKQRALTKNLKQLLHIEERNPASERKLTEASPIQYVQKDMPPFLFIHEWQGYRTKVLEWLRATLK